MIFSPLIVWTTNCKLIGMIYSQLTSALFSNRNVSATFSSGMDNNFLSMKSFRLSIRKIHKNPFFIKTLHHKNEAQCNCTRGRQLLYQILVLQNELFPTSSFFKYHMYDFYGLSIYLVYSYLISHAIVYQQWKQKSIDVEWRQW